MSIIREALIESIGGGLLLFAFLVIGVFVGFGAGDQKISNDCDRKGEFVADGYRYKCEPIGEEK